MNGLPETEEEYYEEEEGNFDEVDSYKHAIEYNYSEKSKDSTDINS